DPPRDGGVPACPPATPPPVDASLSSHDAPWGPATAVPFPCDPMPAALFLPRPGADVPGAYARCASFANVRATSLAVDSTGTRVALIGQDGIARIVDVASHAVVGVLAPARASIGLAAFSPTGDTILTVARGERVATLWRADSFAPVWSTTLPGQPYFKTWAGAAAFSPDGTTVLVSPGADLFLLDAATGSIRAARNQGLSDSSVLLAAYGWNGNRIVVEEAPVSGMCARAPIGGAVSIVDPATLATLSTPMTWPQEGDESPPSGKVWVAAGADLLLTTDSADAVQPKLRAFRVSDGTSLPSPPIPTDFDPLLLTPDGSAALYARDGRTLQLQLQRLSDGAVVATVAAQPAHSSAEWALGISADGTTIAIGSDGGDLLNTWRPAGPVWTNVCSADASLQRDVLALSGDGQLVATILGNDVHVLRRADGTPVSTLSRPGQAAWGVSLSPTGRYAVTTFLSTGAAANAWELFDTASGAAIGPVTGTVVFSPDETLARAACGAGGEAGLTVCSVQLSTGRHAPLLSVAAPYAQVVGLSAGCPVLYSPTDRAVWRACGSCSDPPVATGVSNPELSLDGSAPLAEDVGGEVTGTTLYPALPGGPGLRHYPPRPEASTWDASEVPIAVSTHGDRVITGAAEQSPCAYAPGFSSRVHDVATDATIDDLPPGVTTASADLNVIAFGPVLWCAR
ncbi:MAG TPA: WD40 repeat domain-containing protein, partial [Polyangia bacterium]|nr:WD40 repeat domain-containing protein [Polyangia bacterium]